jgi:hypothetical protein
VSATRSCKCGCGATVPYTKRYLDKAHQLSHMHSGEARRMNQLQPIEAKRRGGYSAGRLAVQSGQLGERGLKGANRTKEVATRLREQPQERQLSVGLA